jgi:2'-5' RNA ligase
MPQLFSTYDEAWAHFQGVEEMESFSDQYPESEAHLLTWYIRVPADDVPGIVDLQATLADIDGLAPIPAERLHVSVAPATVTERPEPALEAELLEQAEEAWAEQPSFDIGIGGVNVFPTAVVAEVRGDGPIDLLDHLLKSGYWRGLPWRAPNRQIFLPHLTVAIATRHLPADPVRRVAEAHRGADYGTVHVAEVQLCRIPVSRSRLLQPWDVVGRVLLEEEQ